MLDARRMFCRSGRWQNVFVRFKSDRSLKWYFCFNLAFFSNSPQRLSGRKIEQIEFKLENSGFMCGFLLYFPT